MDIIYHLVTVLLSEYAQSPTRTKTPWKQAKYAMEHEGLIPLAPWMLSNHPMVILIQPIQHDKNRSNMIQPIQHDPTDPTRSVELLT